MEIFAGTAGVFLIILGVILAILWICLPFAIFGIKDKLDQIIQELKKINEFYKTRIK